MSSILQTMNSTVQKEIAFNSYCREMAKNNVSLACSYIKSAVIGAFTHPVSNSITSLAFKDRCMNLIKTPLLLLRSPLLCLPLANRVTQLALRLLSPKLSIDCINSFSSNKEVNIRYSSNARTQQVKNYFLSNFKNKIPFDSSGLPLDFGFSSEECIDIFTKLSPNLTTELVESSTSEDLQARYSKDMRCKFAEDYFREKIKTKKEITISDLNLSGNYLTIFTNRLGLTTKDCDNAFLKVLTQSPEITISKNLQKKLNRYRQTSGSPKQVVISSYNHK